MKFITSLCHEDLWSKNAFLILACDDIILAYDDTVKEKKGIRFCTLGSLFLGSLKRKVLDQPTVDNGGGSRGRSVAVAVGCWHFDGTSAALQRHYNRKKKKKKMLSVLLSLPVKRVSVSRMRDFS